MVKRPKPKAAETPTLDRPSDNTGEGKQPVHKHVAAVQSIEGRPVQLHLIVGPTFFVELAVYAYTVLFVLLVWAIGAQSPLIMKLLVVYGALCLLGVSLHHTFLHFSPSKVLFNVLRGLFYVMALFTAVLVYLATIG